MNALVEYRLDPNMKHWVLAAQEMGLYSPVKIDINEHLLAEDDELHEIVDPEFSTYASVTGRNPLTVSIFQNYSSSPFFCWYPSESDLDEAIAECISRTFKTLGRSNLSVQVLRYFNFDSDNIRACIVAKVPCSR